MSVHVPNSQNLYDPSISKWKFAFGSRHFSSPLVAFDSLPWQSIFEWHILWGKTLLAWHSRASQLKSFRLLTISYSWNRNTCLVLDRLIQRLANKDTVPGIPLVPSGVRHLNKSPAHCLPMISPRTTKCESLPSGEMDERLNLSKKKKKNRWPWGWPLVSVNGFSWWINKRMIR